MSVKYLIRIRIGTVHKSEIGSSVIHVKIDRSIVAKNSSKGFCNLLWGHYVMTLSPVVKPANPGRSVRCNLQTYQNSVTNSGPVGCQVLSVWKAASTFSPAPKLTVLRTEGSSKLPPWIDVESALRNVTPVAKKMNTRLTWTEPHQCHTLWWKIPRIPCSSDRSHSSHTHSRSVTS